MKRFSGILIYKGRGLSFRFYAKTIKEAARKLNVSRHYINTQVKVSTVTVAEYPYILIKSFGEKAQKDLGDRWMEIEEAKQIIDYKSKEAYKNVMERSYERKN